MDWGGPSANGRAGLHNATPDQSLHRPGIMRGIPPLDITTEKSLLRIEAAADCILAETGIIYCDDPATLALRQAAGSGSAAR